MTSPGGVLDFFILEAGEYVEQLDGLLASASAAAPDAVGMSRLARALRGSATMAKLPAFAELAAGLERLTRGLREGTLGWDPRIRGVVVAAIDDLKLLLRAARTWGPAEDRRARGRIAELETIAPSSQAARPQAAAAPGPAFLVGQLAEIASALESIAAQPAERDLLSAMLDRVRALRGVAALRDLSPVPDIVAAVERAARPSELSGQTPNDTTVALFRAASAALRRCVDDLGNNTRPTADSPEVRQLFRIADEVEEHQNRAERVLPIAELFPDDGGDHVIHRAPNPPQTPAERFRLEVVSHAEHLHALVTSASNAGDSEARARVARGLRAALRELRAIAFSFGERDVAAFVDASAADAASLDMLALSALDEVAMLLGNASTSRDALTRRLAELTRGRVVDAAIAEGFGSQQPAPLTRASAGADLASVRAAMAPIGAPSTAPMAPPPARASAATRAPAMDDDIVPIESLAPSAPAAQSTAAAMGAPPSGRALRDLLARSLDGLKAAEERPMAAPSPLGDIIVPIESLLYRGRDALDRAREIRDAIRRSAGPPSAADLGELYDLLDLAVAE